MRWDGWSKQQRCDAMFQAAARWHYYVVALLLKTDTFEPLLVRHVLFAVVNDEALLVGSADANFEGLDYINQQKLIELLIDTRGAEPDELVLQGDLPLVCRAASNANLAGALRTLLAKGENPDVQSSSGSSALHILASPVLVGRADGGRQVTNAIAIELLLQRGASVTLLNKKGDSPIQLAAFGADLRCFRLFLSSSRNPSNDEGTFLALTNANKETLLRYAAAGGRVDTMDFLVARGLDVNVRNSQGWTPLMCALTPTVTFTHEDEAVTKTPAEAMKGALCLLSHGTDPRIATNEGWTSLHALALHCDLDVHGKIAELATELIARGVDPAARAPLLNPLAAPEPARLGMSWGYGLSDAMMDPPARRMVLQPDMPPLFWAAQRGAVGVVTLPQTLTLH